MPDQTAIFGLDFTSAPGSRKPITCCACSLYGTQLKVEECLEFSSFVAFEAFLAHPGPWYAALDFPFGQPLKFLTQVPWPLAWSDYVAYVAQLELSKFTQLMDSYRASRPVGDKLHLRLADRLAGACSPMMMQRVPVGKMFQRGAPRLLAAGVSVEPCQPRADSRVVFEGYPALVARRWLGKQSYKSDERKKQSPAQLQARQHLVEALCTEELKAIFGVELVLTQEIATRLIEDPMGDQLDALLCALQAAWAYSQRHNGYGIPTGHASEGWIIDPSIRA